MRYALTETVSAILGHPVSETRQNAIVRCPFHDDRHASMSIDLDRGWWICFACGARGGIQSLATRLEREIDDADLALRLYEGNAGSAYEEPQDFSELARELRANLYRSRPDAVVQFITERGLSPAAVKHFGLGWNGKAIAFPYYDEDSVFAVKYRRPDGSKYSETGSRRGIYNVNDIRMKPYVILCEGESDTLAVWTRLTDQYMPDIVQKVGVGGIPGVSASKQTWEVWMLDLLWAERVYIAFDADDAGDSGASVAMSALGEKAVRSRPTNGKDMTEHFLNGGTMYDANLEEYLRLIG